MGLEKMPNISPDEPKASWFHENTLVIRHDEAILDKVPVVFLNGKKGYSASDGGFMTFRTRFVRKDGATVSGVTICLAEPSQNLARGSLFADLTMGSDLVFVLNASRV
jgi:hypothetical protein